MINISGTYPAQTKAPDADYPLGSAQDVGTPGDNTGTPWQKLVINDILGMQQAVLKKAGVTASGDPETSNASDFLDSLLSPAFFPIGEIVASVDKDGNILAQTGSIDGITIASVSTSPGGPLYLVTCTGTFPSDVNTSATITATIDYDAAVWPAGGFMLASSKKLGAGQVLGAEVYINQNAPGGYVAASGPFTVRITYDRAVAGAPTI